VIRGQIEHLIEASQLPNISFRVLPLDHGGPHLGLDGAFTLFDFPDGGQLANLESLVNSIYLEDTASLEAYSRAFEQISQRALDEDASRGYLDQMARAL
jgi:hypothetical protein